MTAHSRIVALFAVIACALSMGVRISPAGKPRPDPGAHVLLAEFEDGWDSLWMAKKFSRSANETRVAVGEDGNRSLEFTSRSSASGMWRNFHLKPVTNGRLSWRWKIERALPGETDERSKDGDDYAARVFVVFSKPLFPWKTRAICYAWAAKEPPGSVYRNPHAKHVAMIILRSGGEDTGKWMSENRDIVADHVEAFGGPPKEIHAFAVMVDTDNTEAATRAWFDDLTFSFE
jgi:hypothetical protein